MKEGIGWNGKEEGIEEKEVKEGIGWNVEKEEKAEEEGIGWSAEKEGIGGKIEELGAMEDGDVESDGELQEAFGNTLGFPTLRRPAESKRLMDRTSSDEEIKEWFDQEEGKKIQIGEQLTETEKSQTRRLLYTWRDQFCEDVRKLPATDLIEHRIPTIKSNPGSVETQVVHVEGSRMAKEALA